MSMHLIQVVVLASYGVLAGAAGAAGPLGEKAATIKLVPQASSATLSLAVDGDGYVKATVRGRGPASVRVTLRIKDGATLSEKTLTFDGNEATSKGRFAVLRGGSLRGGREVVATATLVKGASFGGQFKLVFHKKAAGTARPRPTTPRIVASRAPMRARAYGVPSIVRPGDATPICPKDTIARLVRELFADNRFVVDIKSEMIAEAERLPRTTLKQTNEARKRQDWREKTNRLEPADLRRSTAIRIDRAKKREILGFLLDAQDDVVKDRPGDPRSKARTALQCPFVRYKKIPGSTKPCLFGANNPNCVARVCRDDTALDDPTCTRDCSRAHGYVYSRFLNDKVAKASIVNGVLLSSACVERQTYGQIAERRDEVFGRFSEVPAATVPEKDRILEFYQYWHSGTLRSVAEKAFRSPGAEIVAADCTAAQARHAEIGKGWAWLWNANYAPLFDKIAKSVSPQCTASYAFMNSSPGRWGQPLGPAPAIWTEKPSWTGKSYEWPLSGHFPFKIACGTDRLLTARTIERVQAFVGKFLLFARHLTRNLDEKCQCPDKNRVNLYVEDIDAQTTLLRFHAGKFHIVEGEKIEALIGFDKPSRIIIEPLVAEETLAPSQGDQDPNNLYAKGNDPSRAEPFAQGGLMHVGNECLPYLTKRRLDWLYACRGERGFDPTKVSEAGRSKILNADCIASTPQGGEDAEDARIACLCRKQLLTGYIEREDLPSEGTILRCGDQLRAAMVLAYEVTFLQDRSDKRGHQGKITRACNHGSVKPESFFASLKEGRFTPPAGCERTLRAAIYRGDAPRCAPNCRNAAAEFHAPPPPIPRTMIALETLRRAGKIKVTPAANPKFLNARLAIKLENVPIKVAFRYNGEKLLDVFAPFGDTPLAEEDWEDPVELPVTARIDLAGIPYAMTDSLVRGNPAIGVELASDVVTLTAKGIVAALFRVARDFPVLGDVLALVEGLPGIGAFIDRKLMDFGEAKIDELVNTTVARELHWMASGALVGEQSVSMKKMADKAIGAVVGMVANELRKVGPLKDVIDPARVQRCYENFLKTNRLECPKEVVP